MRSKQASESNNILWYDVLVLTSPYQLAAVTFLATGRKRTQASINTNKLNVRTHPNNFNMFSKSVLVVVLATISASSAFAPMPLVSVSVLLGLFSSFGEDETG